jgi:hypothetical protein
MVWGAARMKNVANTALSADTLAAPATTIRKVLSYFSSFRTPVSSPTVHTPPSSRAGTGVEGEEGVGGVGQEDAAGIVLRGGEEQSASGQFLGGEEASPCAPNFVFQSCS